MYKRLKQLSPVLLVMLLFVSLLCACTGTPQETPQSGATPTPTPNPTPTPSPTPGNVVVLTPIPSTTATANPWDDKISYIKIGDLELPVYGATGYALVSLTLYNTQDEKNFQATSNTIQAGTAFKILDEAGNWWHIQNDTISGWVQHRYCMINLPDVIPSMIYDNTNAYSSLFVASGKTIPNVTGEQLYDSKSYNERLQKEEFVMPVLYATAKKICKAQQLALADGYCLKLYEAFRPYQTQMKVSNAVDALSKQDPEVLAGIATPPWSIDWFISTNASNHQRGYAIDVSLVKVTSTSIRVTGNYAYTVVDAYEELDMPSQMHELSISAGVFAEPFPSTLRYGWRYVKYNEAMTEAAQRLQDYCTDCALIPLASEWWHFNDLDAKDQVIGKVGSATQGSFYVGKCYSTAP